MFSWELFFHFLQAHRKPNRKFWKSQKLHQNYVHSRFEQICIFGGRRDDISQIARKKNYHKISENGFGKHDILLTFPLDSGSNYFRSLFVVRFVVMLKWNVSRRRHHYRYIRTFAFVFEQFFFLCCSPSYFTKDNKNLLLYYIIF